MGKLEKLARVLGTSTDEILGKPAAFDHIGIDPTVSDDRTYFGEIAVHFTDQNAVLLPVSEAARDSLHRQFQGTSAFIVAESLDNRIVFIRREAVADVYFSSKAYDTCGPEEYQDNMGVLPDDSFWQIVEHMDTPQDLADEFDEGEVHRVLGQIGLPRSSGNKSRHGRGVEAKSADVAMRFYERATSTCWQLLAGRLRREYIFENQLLFDTFERLQDPDETDDAIFVPLEGYHRSIIIRTAAVSYISVPKHKFNAGAVANAEEG